jgi:hypothetical protein
VNLELPWTPLRLEQRAGRIDRIGQQRRPHAVHLVAAGTCEETTLATLVSRARRMQEKAASVGFDWQHIDAAGLLPSFGTDSPMYRIGASGNSWPRRSSANLSD